MPSGLRGMAGFDVAQPIGFGQTISQPTTVRRMLEWLDVQPGERALDVGSGSGWTTALLSRLAGVAGKVYAVEVIPELVEFGRDNCQRLGIMNAQFYEAGKAVGLPEFAPFDRILVSASAAKLSAGLTEQLKPEGKMVVPVLQEILEIEKDADGKLGIKSHPGYVFVPLV